MKSFKFKIRRPSKSIVQKFEYILEICRELYNAGLQERRDAWQLNRVSISYLDQQYQLPAIREIREDLKDIYARVLYSPLKRLDDAFQKFFKQVKDGEKAGFPRFKSETRFNSFTYSQLGFWLKGDKLTLSKIGTFRIRLSREVVGKIKACTVKREVDGWFVIFTAETEITPLEKTGLTIGIDVGLENFVTLSNGEKIENRRFLRQSEKRLKTAQRKVSRRKKGSNNRKKSVIQLKKQYLKITRQRLDFQHKTANEIVKKFDEIAVEDLNIRNLVKNHHLAKSINDASWGLFLQILEYKAVNAGKRVWKVNAQNTSQICSGCGETVRKSLSQRIHNCAKCGLKINRDENAAINIKARALPLVMSSVTTADDLKISDLEKVKTLR